MHVYNMYTHKLCLILRQMSTSVSLLTLNQVSLSACGLVWTDKINTLTPYWPSAGASECTDCGDCPPGEERVTAPGSCDESAWPDKDHGIICGECKVLVDNFSSRYQTCDGYCASIGKTCVGAWEENDDDCLVKHDMTCDQTKSGTSDAICQCSPDDPPGVLP